MSHHFRLPDLFEAALHDYKDQTGITLASHPLAEQLLSCNLVDSVSAIFNKQVQVFSGSRGILKATTLLKKITSVTTYH